VLIVSDINTSKHLMLHESLGLGLEKVLFTSMKLETQLTQIHRISTMIHFALILPTLKLQ